MKGSLASVLAGFLIAGLGFWLAFGRDMVTMRDVLDAIGPRINCAAARLSRAEDELHGLRERVTRLEGLSTETRRRR